MSGEKKYRAIFCVGKIFSDRSIFYVDVTGYCTSDCRTRANGESDKECHPLPPKIPPNTTSLHKNVFELYVYEMWSGNRRVHFWAKNHFGLGFGIIISTSIASTLLIPKKLPCRPRAVDGNRPCPRNSSNRSDIPWRANPERGAEEFPSPPIEAGRVD